MQVVLEGHRATIYCLSDNKALYYKIKKNNMEKIRATQLNTLVFSRAKYSDSGEYVCRGTKNKEMFLVSSYLYVACKLIS